TMGSPGDRCRDRDRSGAHDHVAASADGAADLRDRRARGRRALSAAGRLRPRRACARSARSAVRVRAADGLRRGVDRGQRLKLGLRISTVTMLNEPSLLGECRARAIELLKRNLTPAGILASTPNARSEQRGYTAIFGRDAAICALGMAVSGDRELERAAANGLETLAAHQAPNGQMPKF